MCTFSNSSLQVKGGSGVGAVSAKDNLAGVLSGLTCSQERQREHCGDGEKDLHCVDRATGKERRKERKRKAEEEGQRRGGQGECGEQ